MLARARTLLWILLLAALSVAVFSLPGLAIVALSSSASTAETLLDRPELVAGMGSATFLAVLVTCLLMLVRLARVRPAAGVPVDPAEGAGDVAGAP